MVAEVYVIDKSFPYTFMNLNLLKKAPSCIIIFEKKKKKPCETGYPKTRIEAHNYA